MTDTKAKKVLSRYYPQYSDEKVTEDPVQWRSEITIEGWFGHRTYTGTGETKGQARQDARKLASEWAVRLG